MGGIPNALGPSPILGSLGPSHQWRHKSRASLQGPPCDHGVAGSLQEEVRNSFLEEEKCLSDSESKKEEALRAFYGDVPNNISMAMLLGSPLSYFAFEADIDEEEEDVCSRGEGA